MLITEEDEFIFQSKYHTVNAVCVEFFPRTTPIPPPFHDIQASLVTLHWTNDSIINNGNTIGANTKRPNSIGLCKNVFPFYFTSSLATSLCDFLPRYKDDITIINVEYSIMSTSLVILVVHVVDMLEKCWKNVELLKILKKSCCFMTFCPTQTQNSPVICHAHVGWRTTDRPNFTKINKSF